MLHTKAAGRTPSVVVVDSPSLGTTPRNIGLVRGSIASSLSICRVSISVVVDDVAVLVDFQHGLEFGVGDDVHGGRQGVTDMQFYAQVTLLYQMEAGTIALIRGQVKTEEGVAVPEVAASQTVPLVLPNLAGRGEQTRVAPDEEVVFEIGLERFGGYLSSVHVHCEEVTDSCRTHRCTHRYRCSTAPDVSAGCRGTGSRACATERPWEWSTPYNRRIASDT